MKKTVLKTLLLSIFYFQNKTVLYIILFFFKFVVETKLFEAWAYCLRTNLVF